MTDRPDAALAYLASLATEGGWRIGAEIEDAVEALRSELHYLRAENARLRRRLELRDWARTA